MNPILSDYLAICSSFREDGLSKSERKQRHTMLSEWEKKSMTMNILPSEKFSIFGLSIVKFVGTISLSTRLYVLKLP